MASFFRQFNAICPLFCSFVQYHQLELRTSKAYSKRQNLVHNKNIDVQNIDNIGSPLSFFHSDFFRHYATFFEAFWIPPKGLPFNFFYILQHNRCQKSPGSPFYNFRHCDIVQKIFSEIFLNLPMVPLKFFPILQPTRVSQNPKGPPYYNYEP